MRLSLAAIAAVISAVALTAPARATMTASIVGNAPLTITSNGWSYTGLCPVNIVFSATINATVPSTFKYGFNRNTGLGPLTTAAASSGKPYTATDALSFNASGKYWEQLLVTAITPGQPDVYTPDRGVADITITCTAGGTTGSTLEGMAKLRTPTSSLSLLPGLPAPTNVHVTTDPKECAAHLPPQAFLLIPVCGEILAQGGVEIVFSWQGTSAHPDVDGFHVYDAVSHVLDDRMTSTAGGGDTVVMRKGPLAPVCYVIRAYKGSAESFDSQQVCLAGGSSVRTVRLNTTNVRSFEDTSSHSTGIGDPFARFGFAGGSDVYAIVVGHSYWYEKHTLGDQVYNSYTRAGVLFDVQSLRAKFIFKAVLHLHMTGGTSSPDPNSSTFPTRSCVSEVGLGTDLWWTKDGVINGDFSSSESPLGFNDVTVDVTREVRDIIASRPNLGFVLRGSDENLNAFTKSACISSYSVPAYLEVTYN